jgi:hypothetical protein
MLLGLLIDVQETSGAVAPTLTPPPTQASAGAEDSVCFVGV